MPMYLGRGAKIICLEGEFEGNYVDPKTRYHEHNRDRYGDVSLELRVHDTYPILSE